MNIESARGLFIGSLFIALLVTLAVCWWYGRRLISTEKTDEVFGNPDKALGGWHWVISGVATILLVWLYFSWDAARAFFPDAAGEMCQVAKVDTAINPMRSSFPFESRLLRGTSILDRENNQISALTALINSSAFTEEERTALTPFTNRARDILASQTRNDFLDPATVEALAAIATRIDEQAAVLEAGVLPEGAKEAIAKAKSEQPGWGSGNDEVPIEPTSERGALFALVAEPLSDISSEFGKIRNTSQSFLDDIAELDSDVQAFAGTAGSAAVTDFARQMNKLLKRIDNGSIFPPGAMQPVETALARFNDVHEEKQGGLKWVDAIAMPTGTILAGNTACSEQGSGRWLPKPSDTVATFLNLADPAVGYKGVPLLWYKQKPLAEMVGFVVPDFIADLVPGAYPRHGDDGLIASNLKTKVLNFATGNFPSPSIPVPMGHVWDSIMRVVAGLFLGIVLGVPLGLFMGLSRFAKGFFDPMIELYRPVPPLAWAPLILTIFGIQDDGKIFLLFMVAFAIMVISARTGATGTQLSKIHAAHSLGASRWQIVRSVILPNSLPEILTGIRISIGVCWGTLVAAEMLAGTTGIGFVENVARKTSDYEIIWVTIILLGLLGLLFDLVMRYIIHKAIPWRGKG